jgi:hypothetical protein
MNYEKIEFQQSRDFGGIINATFAFLKQNVKDLTLGVLIFCSPFIIAAGILFSLAPRILMINPNDRDFSPTNFFSMILAILLIFIVYYVGLSAINYSFILLYKAKEYKSFTLQDVWKYGVSKMLNILGSIITLVVIFFVTYLASVIIMMIVMAVVAPLLGLLAFILMFLMFFLIFVPLIYVFITFSFLVIVRLNEGVSLMEGIRRCYSLLRGNNKSIWKNWFRSFGLLFVTGLITTVMAYLVQIPFALILFGGESLTSQSTLNQSFMFIFLYTVIYLITTSLLQSINITALSFLYFSLKEEQELQDLAGRINTLGENF